MTCSTRTSGRASGRRLKTLSRTSEMAVTSRSADNPKETKSSMQSWPYMLAMKKERSSMSSMGCMKDTLRKLNSIYHSFAPIFFTSMSNSIGEAQFILTHRQVRNIKRCLKVSFLGKPNSLSDLHIFYFGT
jgi:hypothetical protein